MALLRPLSDRLTAPEPAQPHEEAQPADFDSATAMVQATARYLRGTDLPLLGKRFGGMLRPALTALNTLPAGARRWIYRTGSGREGLAPEVVARADHEQLAAQVVARYPLRTYGAALVGSTPGSAVHLAAALGAPLLPQTLLLPLRHHDVAVDDPHASIAASRDAVAALVERNPDMVVHQMCDPANDRLTLARFSYLRVKRTRLGETFERFLRSTLAPGATLYVVECRHRWPTATVGERHHFQFGGVGGLTPDEYVTGGPRVERFLAEQGSPLTRWAPPAPDGMQPEAEWGLQQGLSADVARFADAHGYRVRRIVFDDSDDLSPAVADLYRWWYRRLGRPADRMFVEPFVLLDPYWVLRSANVPYWVTFNAMGSLRRLVDHLRRVPPYAWIEATLIANGIRTVDMAMPETWDEVFALARDGGRLAGVDRRRFPNDLAIFGRYREQLRRGVRFPLPAPLVPADVEALLGDRDEVRVVA